MLLDHRYLSDQLSCFPFVSLMQVVRPHGTVYLTGVIVKGMQSRRTTNDGITINAPSMI